MSSLTQQARRGVIAAAKAAVTEQTERRPFEWRGDNIMLPVVTVPVGDVLLNHRTHRVRAQVEGLGADGAIIETKPDSEEAQQLLADLIRQTSGYAEVKAMIRHEKQREPGLITHEGVLVNANTRAVALRDLHEEVPHESSFAFIKVQVLPDNADSIEIMQLEFNFQMRRNYQQPYSFTNQLLFIKDLLDSNLKPDEIGVQMKPHYDPTSAKDRRAAAEEVEGEDRLRQIIEELIAASSGALCWPDFDDDRQNLIEIDETYRRMVARKGPDAARRVKQAKLVGLLAGMDYRRVRRIDESYLDSYVLQALEEEPNLRPAAKALAIGQQEAPRADLGGLSLLDDLNEDPPVDQPGEVTLQPLFDVLVRHGKVNGDTDWDAEVEMPTAEGTTRLPKNTFFDAVKAAMQTAADSKAQDDQGQDARDLPRRQLNAAGAACDRVRRAYDELEDDGDQPEPMALERALDAYLRSHDELLRYLSERGFAAAENRL
ncbi:hypothetical protein [Spongiactinospora sp. TRM90649]|uniref:hypothetical protein n=1 Tax=Spongiactinospora sp. TRM90649 TaxID=3031114 RepID=UPI0023F93F22|nr:hypothetical protein [Spongiactinospora sp. TRM90649]MDF5758828.1 hypothetical protein [Spongiactinospora sp. TRM90649]